MTTLRDVPMDAVLRSFNATKPGDDPVIHFYEDFLKAYDKKMRAKRGLFYTPLQFIGRSVDEILKTGFGIEDGLTSTITWGEYLARSPVLLPLPLGEGRGEGSPHSSPRPPLTLPKFRTPETSFVQILDPATGTGTFIVEVITQRHAHMRAKNALEPAHAINPGLAFEAPMLAHEAAAANRVKEQLAATVVVVGNPTPCCTARPTANA